MPLSHSIKATYVCVYFIAYLCINMEYVCMCCLHTIQNETVIIISCLFVLCNKFCSKLIDMPMCLNYLYVIHTYTPHLCLATVKRKLKRKLKPILLLVNGFPYAKFISRNSGILSINWYIQYQHFQNQKHSVTNRFWCIH